MLGSASDVIEISSSDEDEPQSDDGYRCRASKERSKTCVGAWKLHDASLSEPFADDNVHKGVCERNPLCTRGFKHGGFGGHCSLKAIKGINGSSGSRASTISEAWQKHGTVVIASSDKLPLVRFHQGPER